MTQQTHIEYEQLVAYHFGDAAQPSQIKQHLAECVTCKAEFAKLEQMLAAVNEETWPVPQQSADYEQKLWASVKPRLASAPASSWADVFAWRKLAWAGALAAVIIGAFLAGRISRNGQPNAPEAPILANNPPKNPMLVAVNDHLERSQVMLVELEHTEAEKGGTDISAEQKLARDLLSANRLYRQSAKQAKDPAVAAVLDELEHVLVEVANSPSELSERRLEELQDRIEAQGILFKIRVMQSNARSRKSFVPSQPAPAAKGRS